MRGAFIRRTNKILLVLMILFWFLTDYTVILRPSHVIVSVGYVGVIWIVSSSFNEDRVRFCEWDSVERKKRNSFFGVIRYLDFLLCPLLIVFVSLLLKFFVEISGVPYDLNLYFKHNPEELISVPFYAFSSLLLTLNILFKVYLWRGEFGESLIFRPLNVSEEPKGWIDTNNKCYGERYD